MLKFKSLIALVLLLASVSVSAQIKKFGKVSTEELQQSQHPLHPEADAAFLFRDIRVYYSYVKEKGFVLNKEVHERVKIYNKAGFEWELVEYLTEDPDQKFLPYTPSKEVVSN